MTPPEAPDADLVAGVLAGDRTAFAAVYERYADRLHDFAFSMTRNREEAADCVADSFVVMAEKLGQLRDPDRLRPWLYSVVRNECLRQLRARGRVAHDDEWLEAMPDDAATPEQQVVRADDEAALRTLVWDAVEGLNERDRALLDLHLRQGLDGAELAAAMDVTPANSYVMLSRARDQVERSLGALLIARRGSDDCTDLASLLSGWDGRFSPLIRKRVARHIDGCDVCESRRKVMVSPLALLAGVPAFAAPVALRDRVLEDPRLVSYYVEPGAGDRAAAVLGGGSGTSGGRRPRVGVLTLVVVLLVLGGWGLSSCWPGADEVALDAGTPLPPATSTPPDPDPVPTPSTALTPSGSPASTPTTPQDPTSTPTTPPTTAPTTTAAPGELVASTRRVSLGAEAVSATVRLTNVGGTALDLSPASRVRWLSAGAGSRTLAPGASTTLRITARRSGLPEGDHVGRVTATWSGGTVAVTVVLTVDRAPVIGPLEGNYDAACSPDVSTTVTDASGVSSVRIAWSGGGSTGSTTMTLSGGRWRASIGTFSTGGEATVTVTATDRNGNTSRRTSTVAVVPCPG